MRPRPNRPPGSAGFTLVEVIVALVLLSSGMLAFYEFLGASLHAAGRVRAAAEAYDRDENALALAATLNPMATPEGIFDLGGYRIRWRAEPITPLARSTAAPAPGPGPFVVALYRIVLDFPEDREFAPVTVTKFGYHPATAPVQPSRQTVN